jgi:Uma2 family endonuclease
MTPDEYLEADRKARFRSEYYQGRMYAMSGGTYPHATVILNLAAELRQALRQTPCTVTASEARLRISVDGLYTYPDIMVVCGEARFADDQKDTVLNPAVIIEVLSKSTEAYDRGLKFAEYRKLDSLCEYVLVSVSEPRVERFCRQSDGRWLLSDCAGPGAACRLETLDCQVLLSDIYHKVTFTEEPLHPPDNSAAVR